MRGLRKLRIIEMMILRLRNLLSPQEGLGRVTFAASGPQSGFVREPEDNEEEYHDSIGEAPVIDKFSIA